MSIAEVVAGVRTWHIEVGHVLDGLRAMPADSVHCVCTSPPYFGLRDYKIEPQTWGGDPACEHSWEVEPARIGGGKQPGEKQRWQHQGGGPSGHGKTPTTNTCAKCGAWSGSLGLEPTPELFVAHLVEVFREVRRVLRPDGVCWVNLGDSFASGKGTCFNPGGGDTSLGQDRKAAGIHPLDRGSVTSLRRSGLKPKDLVGIPWLAAFALRADGWWLRSALPWVKRSAMPESVVDRPCSALEYVFLLTKQSRYFFDMEAVRRPVAAATVARDRYTRILDEDGPQSVRHDHESTANPGGRSFRNADLWFESIEQPHGLVGIDDEIVGLDVNTEGLRDAHFATFPTKLVTPLLKAATSERGCCASCGAPWRRVYEEREKREPIDYEGKHLQTDEQSPGRRMLANQRAARAAGGAHDSPFNPRATIGWRPTCRCAAAEPVPCLVLDPFAGAATTLMVARRLGCRAIGHELNPEYAAMGRRRVRADQPLMNAS